MVLAGWLFARSTSSCSCTGNITYRDFFLVDLRNGRKQQLSDLKFAFRTSIFPPMAADPFDRWKEESDIVPSSDA